MTNVAISPENLKNAIAQALGEKVRAVKVALDEVTIEVAAKHYLICN